MQGKSYLLLLLGFMFFLGIFIVAIYHVQNNSSSEITCNDTLWDRFYNSNQLKVLEKCKGVTGIIVTRPMEEGRDVYLLLKPDPGQENLLNEMNYESQDSCLVLKPVSCSIAGQSSGKDTCRGFVNKVFLPLIGQHVKVAGTFVFDIKHGWNEIHPVTRITLLKN